MNELLIDYKLKIFCTLKRALKNLTWKKFKMYLTIILYRLYQMQTIKMIIDS